MHGIIILPPLLRAQDFYLDWRTTNFLFRTGGKHRVVKERSVYEAWSRTMIVVLLFFVSHTYLLPGFQMFLLLLLLVGS